MHAPQWTPITPAGISGHRHSSTLVHDPELGALLFTQGAGVRQRDLWRWNGTAFEPHATGLLPSYDYSTDMFRIFACHDPVTADVLLFGLLGHRDTPEARAPLTGVVRAPLRSPSTERVLAYPPELADDRAVFTAFRLGRRLLLLAVDGTVLEIPDEGDALHVAGAPIEDLDVERHHLHTAAADHERGVLVAGTDDDGLLFTWHPDTGWSRAGETGTEGGSLTWDPVTRRVQLLVGQAGPARVPQILRPYDEPDAPGPALGRFTRAAPIVRAEADGTWLIHGRPDETYLAAPGAETFTLADPPLAPPFDAVNERRLFTSTPGGTVWSYKPDGDEIAHLDGDTWVTAEAGVDAALAAASPRGLMILDEDGGLHRIDTTGRTVRISEADDLVEAGDAETDVLCWDAAAGRLLLHKPLDTETYVFAHGEWTEIEWEGFPPEEDSLLCAGPGGVYCFADGRLWHQRDTDWTPIGEDDTTEPALVFWSERHGGLWAVSDDGLHVWRDGGFAHVTDLPPGVAMPEHDPDTVVFFDTGSRAVHDPAGDRVLVYGGGGTWTLSLDAVADGPCETPGGFTAAAADDRTATAASCYVFECSGSSAWRDLELLAAHPDLDSAEKQIRHWLATPSRDEIDDFGITLEFVTTVFARRLWTVHHGVLRAGLDLAPYTSVRFGDGTTLATTEENLPAIWARETEATAVELDWAGIVAALDGPLPEPLIGEGAGQEVTVDGVEPDAASVLADGVVVKAG